MDVAAPQRLELVECLAGVVVPVGGHGQGDEHLVGVQPWVAAAQSLGLELLDRLDGGWGQQVDAVIDPGQDLEGVEQHRRGAAQQGRGLTRHDAPVGQLDR